MTAKKKHQFSPPLSLSPLKFMEALTGLLKVKPKKEGEEDQEKEGKAKDNK